MKVAGWILPRVFYARNVGMDALIPKTGFGELNFGMVQLGDRRRTRRLVQAADRILQHPCGTLPDKLNHPAELKGLYRLVDQDRVTHAAVLSQHRDLVRQRMQACAGDILMLHDTTELDYTGKTTLADLGFIGKGHRQRGYLCHHSLAVVAGTREVLGLASQILHHRPASPENETRATRRSKPDRESRLWRQGCEACPAPSTGPRVIDIADRGADLFEFLEFEQAEGRRYVVRSRHDRGCEVQSPQGPQSVRLHAFARALPAWGEYEVDVPTRDKRPARMARVRIAAGQVRLAPPRLPRGQHGDEPLTVWVVYVGEIDPPKGAEPVEWILLTNVSVESLAEARERVGWYAHRWIIEELHKAQKTGCGIELPQFTKLERLEPMIALLSVVAVELLRLRTAARSPDTQARPATEYVPKQHMEVVSAWRYGAIRELTVHEFYFAVARLGGHQNRKHDHPPGWLVLWRGWAKLESMVIGAIALKRARCG
jgi:hypothetical protein